METAGTPIVGDEQLAARQCGAGKLKGIRRLDAAASNSRMDNELINT